MNAGGKSFATRIIAAQILFGLAFLSVVGTESRIRAWLVRRGIDSFLVSTLHGSIARCAAFLCLGTIAFAIWAFLLSGQSNEKPERKSWLSVILLGLGFDYVIFTRLLQFPISRDDAYIDYRHVLNLVVRHSLDYNPGSPVMGFTSHLHYLLLSFLTLVTGYRDLSVLSQCFNLIVQLVVYVFIFIVAARITRNTWAGLFAAVAYALIPYDLYEPIGGKESVIVQFLILLSIWAAFKGSLRLLAWTGALLFLCRPEGLFYLAACMVWTVAKQGWRAWRAWALPCAMLAVWYSILLVHFGTVLPHGALAKKLIYYGYDSAPRQMLDIFSSWTGLRFGLLNIIPIALAWTLVFRRSGALALYCIGMALVALFFVVSKPPIMFTWYLAWFSILAPFAFAILFDGAAALASKPPWRIQGLIALSAVCLMPAAAVESTFETPVRSLAPLFLWTSGDQRLLLYRRAAETINATGYTGPVAVSEPGAFGYFYKGYVIDLGGLVSAEMIHYLPIPMNERWPLFNTAIPNSSIRGLQPRYVVYFDAFARQSLLVNDWFRQNYTQTALWPLKAWTINSMMIYQKRDPGAAETAMAPARVVSPN